MAVSFNDGAINIYIQLMEMQADDTAFVSTGNKGYREYQITSLICAYEKSFNGYKDKLQSWQQKS